MGKFSRTGLWNFSLKNAENKEQLPGGKWQRTRIQELFHNSNLNILVLWVDKERCPALPGALKKLLLCSHAIIDSHRGHGENFYQNAAGMQPRDSLRSSKATEAIKEGF